MSLSPLLTLRQAADLLNVAPLTLRRWDNEGKLPAVHIGSRGDRRYRRADLDAFVESRNPKLVETHELYKQGGESWPWFMFPPAESWVNNICNDLISEFDVEYVFFFQKFAHIFYRKDNMMSMARQVFNYSEETLNEWHEHTLYAGEQLRNLYMSFTRLPWKRLTTEDFFAYNQQLRDTYAYFWDFSIFIDSFDAGFDQEMISAIAKEHHLSADDVITLTTIPILTYSQEFRSALLLLAQRHKKKKISKARIRQFVREYDWVHSSYASIQHLAVPEIVKELHVLARDSSLDKQIAALNEFSLNRQREERHVLHRHHLQRNPLRIFQLLTQWREERKKFNTIGFHALEYIAQAIARKTGIPVEDIYFVTPQEVIPVLAGKLSRKELAYRRNNGALFLYRKNGVRQTLVGDEARSLFQDLEKSSASNAETNVLAGVVASRGYAKGTARVILNEKDFTKLRRGDILVTSMTRPEFLPIMEKAAAFVTDEGGITSHAAIVAREMKKPCIIGTRDATKRIKDGDIVEVRAHHGTVRILTV